MSFLTENQGANPPGLTLTQTAPRTSDTQKDGVQMADEPDYEPSDASSYDPAAALLDTISQSNAPSKKRRQSIDSTDLQQPKKVRLQEADSPSPQSLVTDRAKQAPAEIWQYIFTFVPPRDLGRLLAVNKLFHAFLSPFIADVSPSHSVVPSSLPPLKPEAIWQASRRLFWPRMPAPLKGRSEVQMWRLICSVSCQFCGSKSQKKSQSLNNEGWRSGPGLNDVCPIFPFCVFTCGSCLRKKGIKEIDLLLSSSFPSFLLPALPPVFVDADMHIISPRAMQMGVVPQGTQVTKVFWSEHVDQIKTEFEQVKALGSAAAEEWIKGLEIRGKQALVDASRWDKWANAGGMAQIRMPKFTPKPEVPIPAASLPPIPPSNQTSSDAVKQGDEQEGNVPDTNGKPGPTVQLDASSQQSRTPSQQKRTKEEVAQLKAQRRADIERRAMLLDPPLTSNVLAHIPSFQAALQLITPLDDDAWELLKPRLLAQRSEAELREKQSIANVQALQDKLVKKETAKKPAREPREVPDQEWDDIQGPVRARISAYADEIIQGWNNGAHVKRKNCPQYAADVLLYVRKRFYAEVAKDTAAIIAAGKQPIVEPPEGPWTQRLTLENMKWIFDVKVKSRTEPMRKELFLCNGCLGGNGTLKYFGLEGVLQHYAAKHTTALSLGNVVVHWRAEWPEVPPFCPDLRAKEKAYYGNDTSSSLPSTGSSSQATYPGFQGGPPTGYAPPVYGAEAQAPPLPHYGSASAYSMPPYGQGGAHAYGMPYSSTTYQEPAAYASYPPPFSSGMVYSSHDQSNGYTAPPASAPSVFGYGAYPSHHDRNNSTSTGNSHRVRLDTIVKRAHDVWSIIGTNKKIPPAVRAYAVFHHVARIFEETYGETVSLSMFTDAMMNRGKLRPMRQLNGVSCQACEDNPTFHLPQLAKHFRKEHVELPESRRLPPMDWRTHMIKLPEEERLAVLADKLRENPLAYAVVKEAIPWAFEQTFIDKFAQTPLPAKPTAVPVRETNKPPNQVPSGTASDHSRESLPNNGTQIKDQVQQLGHYYPASQPQTTRLPNTGSSQAQLHDESEQDIPHLRPASEVYGRKNRRAPKDQERPAAPADIDASRSDDYSPPDFEGPRQSAREIDQGGIRIKTEHAPITRPPSGPNSRNGLHWRDERSLDYRDVREQRYSGTEVTGPRDRSASVGNRPQEHHPSAPVLANAAPSYVEAGTRAGDRPPVVAPNHQIVEEEVVYVDESGREIGRGLRARDTLPRESRYGVPDDRRFGDYGHPSSSWWDDRRPAHHREHSPQYQYARPEYHYESGAASHRVYYDHHDARPTMEHPAEPYELVEVRHPDGDYFIRRPIRRDDRPPYYVYDTRPPPREQSVYPPQRVTGGPPGAHVGGYAVDPRANPAIPGQPATRPGYDDYDPRYPSSATEQPPTYHGN
ncbi:hypothetical protein NW762_001054 [Fusarium torreyae]|uniref:DUF7892 domain-containing protein n=1 Tax=Fusarium torreyae TaxID=1237075 RepID=A0A9W8SJL7_9HYPO|nr:hypothetical protein NW762_001054 [Fusarium torreyae]